MDEFALKLVTGHQIDDVTEKHTHIKMPNGCVKILKKLIWINLSEEMAVPKFGTARKSYFTVYKYLVYDLLTKQE